MEQVIQIPIEEDLFAHPRCKPQRLDKLCKVTKFSRDEIRLMYQGFKQVSAVNDKLFLAAARCQTNDVNAKET